MSGVNQLRTIEAARVRRFIDFVIGEESFCGSTIDGSVFFPKNLPSSSVSWGVDFLSKFFIIAPIIPFQPLRVVNILDNLVNRKIHFQPPPPLNDYSNSLAEK